MADITEAAKTDDNRQSGGKFGPGNCANPGGRPKMSKEEREAWQALATKCRVKMEKLIESGELPPATLAKFAEVALDRAYGKAIQSVDISPGDGGGIGFSFVDPPSRSPE
jgi:hypothetical protein